MKFNYHTHTLYSDGYVSIDEIVECAIGNDFDIIGISDHSPVPFHSEWNMKYEKITSYLNELQKAKEKFAGRIIVLTGMEIDFFNGLYTIEHFKNFGLDYTIGSVHYLGKFPNGKPFNIDKSQNEFMKGLVMIYDDDVEKLATDYYQEVIKMVLNERPDIIAHLTLIEKFNDKLKVIDTGADWYRELVRLVLDIIRQTECVLEVNARSWYRGLSKEFVPALWVLKEANKFKIPVTINGDVHQPQEFGMYWDDAVEFVKAAGYDEIVYFLEKGERKYLKLN